MVTNKERRKIEFMEKHQKMPLIGGLPKFHHVEKLGHSECDGILDGHVIVQEKLDGANLTVADMGGEHGLVVCSRRNPLYHSGETYNPFRGAVEWVLNSGVIGMLAKYPTWVLRGEWLVPHTIKDYSPDAFKQFYIFDVQIYERDREELHYVMPTHWMPVCKEFQVPVAPLIREIPTPLKEEIVALADGPSMLGAQYREGIVVKNYNWTNKYGRKTWAKIVRSDFAEKCKLHMGAVKKDPPELRFAAIVDRHLVLKEIEKIRDRGEEPCVRHMGEIIGRCWRAAWEDNLWTFVKKEKVKEFDFRTAQKLVNEKVRTIAMAYFTGIE